MFSAKFGITTSNTKQHSKNWRTAIFKTQIMYTSVKLKVKYNLLSKPVCYRSAKHYYWNRINIPRFFTAYKIPFNYCCGGRHSKLYIHHKWTLKSLH